MPEETVEQILLVDDNPANLDLLEQVLRGRGYRVRSALSGRRPWLRRGPSART